MNNLECPKCGKNEVAGDRYSHFACGACGEKYGNSAYNEIMEGISRRRKILKYCKYSVAPVAAILIWVFFVKAVPASHIGIPVTMGSVGDSTLSEGINIVNPMATVHTLYLGLQTASSEKANAASKDLQTVRVDMTVNFFVKPDKARELFILNPSRNYKAQYMVPAVNEVLKAVISRYTAEELVTKRAEVSEQILLSLKNKVDQYHLAVRDINITNFSFSKAFDEAIEAKVTATQQAEKAMRDLERIRHEAEQKIVASQAEAKAIRIKAEAIQQQGGKSYVSLEAVNKWDGKLPQYMGGNAPVPFISMSKD